MKKETYKRFLRRFANGEQYLYIDTQGKIAEHDKQYFWQERAVYNRILPLLDSRRLKFITFCRDKGIEFEKFLEKFDESELFAVVERCVPIQRAYNAVKNRKMEFINRLSAGVIAVEDGSVDVDNLEEEGLSPGKILVYRQGSNPPTPFQSESKGQYEIYTNEEDKLVMEFVEFLNSERLNWYFNNVVKD